MGLKRTAATKRHELVRRLIAERESTGETWRSIATRTGIKYATLTGWVWRWRREEGPCEKQSRSSSEFIELVAPDAPRSSVALELTLRGDRRVRIEEGFDAATLVRLVQALEAC